MVFLVLRHYRHRQQHRWSSYDFNDIYAGITPDEITLQLDENVGYEHHSKFWNNQIEEQTASLEKTIQAEDEAEKKTGQVYGTTDGLTQEKFMSAEDREAEEQKTHHKTVDFEEVYDGMTVQLSDHSLLGKQSFICSTTT